MEKNRELNCICTYLIRPLCALKYYQYYIYWEINCSSTIQTSMSQKWFIFLDSVISLNLSLHFDYYPIWQCLYWLHWASVFLLWVKFWTAGWSLFPCDLHMSAWSFLSSKMLCTYIFLTSILNRNKFPVKFVCQRLILQ